jgi:hypothetical protein
VTAPLLARLELLARDVGCLRRRSDPEASTVFLIERVADAVLTIDAIVHPSAGKLAVEFFSVCGDHEVAVEEALRVVDDRARLVRGLLGREARR